MKLVLDSENIYGDDIANIKEFIGNLSIEDLLELDELISEERNRRIEIIIREREKAQAQE